MRFECSVVFASLALLAACGSSDGPSGAPSGGGMGGVGGVAGAGGQGGISWEEARFKEVLDGAASPGQAFADIAQADGFPIETASGFLFARIDDGAGPYALAGDFNGFVPEPMTAQAGLYWIVRPVVTPDGAKYKFANGADQLAADPYARRYGWDEHGEYSLVSSTAAHRQRFVSVKGQGRPARTIRVWVPASLPTRHLYAHDGQNLFEPGAPFGGWNLHQIAGSQTLIVAIDNTGAGRLDEYTHVQDNLGSGFVGGMADSYADYVELSVRPLVEKRYGVPQRVGVLGSSLGGLVSVHIALRHPGRYDFVGALSGTFGWGSIGANNPTLIENLTASGKVPGVLYLDSGGGPGSGCVDSDGDGIQDDAPDASDNYCETAQLRDVAANVGYVFETDLFHWHEPGAPHNEAAWAARAHRPLGIFEGL